MLDRLPQSLQAVVNRLGELPGVGRKSALRMGLTLLQWPEEKVRSLGQSILELRDALCLCSQCGSLSDADPCAICSDPARRDDLVCVVADWDSLLTIDEAGFYRGKYLVLGGLISPLDGVHAGSLDLQRLKDRLERSTVSELILALGTTRKSEATESYIRNMIADEVRGVTNSRLAQGIPIGSELKFVDRETLKQSLNFRQQL